MAPQDEAMIRILSQLAVERNWWSFSVNPTPMGKQFIVQPQSQWERDRERQSGSDQGGLTSNCPGRGPLEYREASLVPLLQRDSHLNPKIGAQQV